MTETQAKATPLASPARSWTPGLTAGAMAAAGLVLILLVAGLVAWQLRGTVRAELVQRDAEVLHSYMLLRQGEVEARLLFEPDLPLAGELLDLVLEASRLRGVLGVRMVATDGELVEAVPLTFVGTFLSGQASIGKPAASFQRAAQPADYLLGASEPALPLLEVRLPLAVHGEAESFTGEAQFLLDASSLAGDMAELDTEVRRMALVLVSAAAVGLILLAVWAARMLERGAADLARRQAELARTNAELAMATRTATVGALTGHLLHGLKNPLSGLESFIELASVSPLNPEDWNDAEDAVKRMRKLLNSVIEVLQAEDLDAGIDLAGDNVLAALRAWFGDAVEWPESPAGKVPGRMAQLVVLVLTNLLQNAREAAPEKRATLRIAVDPAVTYWRWTVHDRGNGLPAEVQKRLFLPVTSGKPGGSGLGLALASQLARAAGGELRLASTGPEGTVFELTHPAMP